jgi:hypothetical protein
MADDKNTEVVPASEAAAPVETAAPATVVREKRSWTSPLVTVLAVVLALVVGGVGGFAIARASGPVGPRQAMQQGEVPGGQQSQPGPGQQGPGQQGQQGQQQGPGGQQSGPGGQQGPGGPGGQQGQPPRPDGDQDAPTDAPTEGPGDSGN